MRLLYGLMCSGFVVNTQCRSTTLNRWQHPLTFRSTSSMALYLRKMVSRLWHYLQSASWHAYGHTDRAYGPLFHFQPHTDRVSRFISKICAFYVVIYLLQCNYEYVYLWIYCLKLVGMTFFIRTLLSLTLRCHVEFVPVAAERAYSPIC